MKTTKSAQTKMIVFVRCRYRKAQPDTPCCWDIENGAVWHATIHGQGPICGHGSPEFQQQEFTEAGWVRLLAQTGQVTCKCCRRELKRMGYDLSTAAVKPAFIK